MTEDDTNKRSQERERRATAITKLMEELGHKNYKIIFK